jgi:hypothetical protein
LLVYPKRGSPPGKGGKQNITLIRNPSKDHEEGKFVENSLRRPTHSCFGWLRRTRDAEATNCCRSQLLRESALFLACQKSDTGKGLIAIGDGTTSMPKFRTKARASRLGKVIRQSPAAAAAMAGRKDGKAIATVRDRPNSASF